MFEALVSYLVLVAITKLWSLDSIWILESGFTMGDQLQCKVYESWHPLDRSSALTRT